LKSATAVIAAVPLFALFIPLLIMVMAMARCWLRGALIAQADAPHIHHRLAATGFSHREAVLLLYLFAAGFARPGHRPGLGAAPAACHRRRGGRAGRGIERHRPNRSARLARGAGDQPGRHAAGSQGRDHGYRAGHFRGL